MKNDPVKIARYQKEISEHLGLPLENLVFNFKEFDIPYNDSQENIRLDLVTINPTHDQSFLFHSTTGYDKLLALKKMIEYIKGHIRKESTFTVQWSKVETNEFNTSYFSAHDMQHVLDKFSYNKDMNKIVIFSMNLNPIS